MTPRMYLQDAQQQALSFLISQAAHIEPQAIAIKYPDIQYPKLVPIDMSANEWSKSVTYFSTDKLGAAEWFHHTASDIPIADITREKLEVGIEMAGIGYRYTLEELGQAQLIPGTNLGPDRAAAARRAYEEFVDAKVLNGDATKGWEGLLNNSNVTSALVAADGNGGNTYWDDKGADLVLRDVNSLLSGVYEDSLTVEMADTLLLPVAAHTSIATRRITDTNITILEFLKRYNVYTAMSNAPLTIMAVRGLETAGAGGTGRMIAYRRDAQVLKLHLPMSHRFLPAWQRGPLVYEVPGIFRLGGLEIRRPGAVRYGDGIIAAPYE